MLRKHLWFLKAAIHFPLLLKTAGKIYPLCAVSSSLNVPFHKVHFVLLPCMTFVYGKHRLLRSHNLTELTEHKWYLINIWTEGLWIVDSLIFYPCLFLGIADWRHPQDFFTFFFSPLTSVATAWCVCHSFNSTSSFSLLSVLWSEVKE